MAPKRQQPPSYKILRASPVSRLNSPSITSLTRQRKARRIFGPQTQAPYSRTRVVDPRVLARAARDLVVAQQTYAEVLKGIPRPAPKIPQNLYELGLSDSEEYEDSCMRGR